MYIITKDELERYESMITGSLKVQGSNIRSRPLSEHDAEIAKKERGIVLDELFKSLKYGGLFTMCETMDTMRKSLRGEP